MESIMNFALSIRAIFDVLEAIPFFGPLLVISTSVAMVANAVRSK